MCLCFSTNASGKRQVHFTYYTHNSMSRGFEDLLWEIVCRVLKHKSLIYILWMAKTTSKLCGSNKIPTRFINEKSKWCPMCRVEAEDSNTNWDLSTMSRMNYNTVALLEGYLFAYWQTGRNWHVSRAVHLFCEVPVGERWTEQNMLFYACSLYQYATSLTTSSLYFSLLWIFFLLIVFLILAVHFGTNISRSVPNTNQKNTDGVIPVVAVTWCATVALGWLQLYMNHPRPIAGTRASLTQNDTNGVGVTISLLCVHVQLLTAHVSIQIGHPEKIESNKENTSTWFSLCSLFKGSCFVWAFLEKYIWRNYRNSGQKY